ncbi:hypothetical protein FDP41_004369 [Naegleria fowleri]|uniref:G domain-containing protein n=1 Tax=Naegleria fowleri TaxID=5763 RepID=A0A6A5BRN2_NAEFO|nr:uncharacterized protein FDP41_004369 [Naegleria fowleri]KAF0976470.1 hypothetical protein FDP41_004369 [Naegleria fowleri]CAG4709769.1 unnamed protein product [Naegleria fowleri]
MSSLSSIVNFYLPESDRVELNQSLSKCTGDTTEIFTKQDFEQFNNDLNFVNELGNKRSAVFLGNPQSGKTTIIQCLTAMLNPRTQNPTPNSASSASSSDTNTSSSPSVASQKYGRKYGADTQQKNNFSIEGSTVCHAGLNLIDLRGIFEKELNESDEALQQTRQDILHQCKPNMIVVVLKVHNVKEIPHCYDRELYVLREAAYLRTKLIDQMKKTTPNAKGILPIHIVVHFIDEYDETYQQFCEHVENYVDDYKLVQHRQHLAEVEEAKKLAEENKQQVTQALKSIEENDLILDAESRQLSQLIDATEREIQQLKTEEHGENPNVLSQNNSEAASAPLYPNFSHHENPNFNVSVTGQEKTSTSSTEATPNNSNSNSTPTKATSSFSSLFGMIYGVFKRGPKQESSSTELPSLPQQLPPQVNEKLEIYSQKLQIKNRYSHERNLIENRRYQLDLQKIEHQSTLSRLNEEITRYEEYLKDMKEVKENIPKIVQRAYMKAYDELHHKQEDHINRIREEFKKNSTFNKLLYESGILTKNSGTKENQHVYFHFTCVRSDYAKEKHKALLFNWGLKQLADSIQTCRITMFERVSIVTDDMRRILAGKIIEKFVEIAEKKAKLMSENGGDKSDYPPVFWKLLLRTLSMIGDQKNHPTRTFEYAWKIISEGDEVKTATWYYDMSKVAYKLGFIIRPIIPLGNWCHKKSREKIPLVGAWATNFYLGARGPEYVVGNSYSNKRKSVFKFMSSSKEGSTKAPSEDTSEIPESNSKRNRK